MSGLAPEPGEKPWNLNAFGQPLPTEPPHTDSGLTRYSSSYVQVVANHDGTEQALTRIHALAQVLETRIRNLPAGQTLDPTSITLSTQTIAGTTLHRATYTTQEPL